MFNIDKKTYKNNWIEALVDIFGILWLNEKHIEEKLGHKNLPAITNKYNQVYEKQRYELVNEAKKQPNRRFLRSDLALKVIMGCKTGESSNLKRNLGFRLHDVINTKEQTVLESIKNAFGGQDMQTQYSVLGYRINLYFHEYKLPIEVDELGQADKNLSNKIERQKALEKELDCVFIRINPDEKNFKIFEEINKMHRCIKKSTKNLLIDDLAERFLKLEFKSNHSIKSKCSKWIVKKILPAYKKMKNIQLKIKAKAIKLGKRSGTTYCLGCKDYTHNFRPQEVKMTNQVLREKSNCVICRPNKSRFLKQKHNNKK